MKTKIAVISILLALVALFLFGCWESPVNVLQETAILPPKLIERTGQDLSMSQELPFTKAILTANQLAAAILTPGTAPLLMSASMSGVPTQFEVYAVSLQGFPTKGSSYALISNGNASSIAGVATDFYSYFTGGPISPPYSHRGAFSYDIATLSLTLSVPNGAKTLSFDWKFGTEENPQYTTTFRDWASAIVTTSTGSTNILLLPGPLPVDVYNAAPFSNAVSGTDSSSPGPPYPSPNDTVYNAVTGMYTSTFNVTSFVGEIIRIDFQVGDENDEILDSALFIDNLNLRGLGGLPVNKKIPFIDGSVFANKQWIIDTDESPGGNQYSDSIENIWLDKLGQLHFKMTKDEGTKKWNCVEIYSDQQGWGYGKYEFEIEVVSDGKIDENVVIGLFTYDNSIIPSHNEIDIEFSKWGYRKADNGNFVVWYDADNEKRNLYTFSLQLAGNSSIHSFEWTNDNIVFYSSEMTFCPLYPESFEYKEGGTIVGPSGEGYGYIPDPNKERVYMNLWLFKGKPYNEKKMEEVELVIKDFKFTPINSSP